MRPRRTFRPADAQAARKNDASRMLVSGALDIRKWLSGSRMYHFDTVALMRFLNNDRQVDTLSVRCAGAQTPEHDDAIGNGQEFGFKLSAVLGLVAIPGCPKSFGVT